VRRCLAAGEFLVLQELFATETSHFADALLPAASFAEKAGTFTNTERRAQLIRPAVPPPGTFTNTERRAQLIRPAVPPPGEARPDWAILAELARRVLTVEGRAPVGPHGGWEYRGPAEIMAEVAALTPLYAGISHARLGRGDRLQWPVPSPDHPGTPILHVGRFSRGKGKFHAVDYLPPAEVPDAAFPFTLTTGRVLYHYGSELTRRAQGLTEAYPEPLIEISPEDAGRLGLNGHTTVRLRSRRGEALARAVITDRVAPGVVFGNFHFPGHQNVNDLTNGALDPVAKIPEYKVCAVAVEAAPATTLSSPVPA
jgi:formate dehydrogenase major subunit/formate dehydrogenase alpha subunit